MVDSACLTYSHKCFLGYTKKINEFKLEQWVSHRHFVTVVIYAIFRVYVAKKISLTLTSRVK